MDYNKLEEILRMPTTLDRVHESVYRSYAILDYVEWLCAQDTPTNVIAQIVHDLRGMAPKQDHTTVKGS